MNDPIAFEPLTLVRNARLIVCCGSGGVGKTTTAAALAVLAAGEGRSALVLTIDPARRLAQALGLETLSHEPQQIALEVPGTLSAMMLDSKHTFDSLIESYAPSAEVRDAIFANAYYQHLSTSLAGSREFMAMEKVYELAEDGRYDLLIVDTPPAQHALDFLDAPQRLLDLFDGAFVKLLVQPYRVAGRLGFNIIRRSSDRFLKVFEKLSGYEVLADLSNFFLAFSSMFDGFKERSRRVMRMLRATDTSFVLICAPEPGSLTQIGGFFRRLDDDDLPVGGLIVNRVHRAEAIDDPASYSLSADDLELLAGIPGDPDNRPLVERLTEAYRDHVMLAVLDQAAIASTQIAGAIPVITVPHFNRDLHSIEDLQAVAGVLGKVAGSEGSAASGSAEEPEGH
jgi:anion-transporting  ArsA/GET3 family ATPase